MKDPYLWIKPGAVCAEIGVWKGDGAEKILARSPSKLHLIDPWEFQDYPGRVYSADQSDMDDIYGNVKLKFKDNPIVQIHKEYSQNSEFPKDYFDWVYIDGNHSYETVMADLERFWPFIKTGGILSGDDYGWQDPKSSGGPKKAVHDFAEKMGIMFLINHQNFQFIFFKGLPNTTEAIQEMIYIHEAKVRAANTRSE